MTSKSTKELNTAMQKGDYVEKSMAGNRPLYPFNISYNIRTPVEHRPQYFSGHDKTRSLWPHTNITSEKTNIKFSTEVPILLVANCFNWSSIDSSGTVLYDMKACENHCTKTLH
jgi:hypothetical protein